MTIDFVVADIALNGFCSRFDVNESDKKMFVPIIVLCERYVNYEDENKVWKFLIRFKLLTSLLFCTVKTGKRKSEADRQIG